MTKVKLMNAYFLLIILQFSRSVVSDSLQPHGLQHARPPCPSPNSGVYPNSSPLWRKLWHPTPVLLPGKSHGQRTLVGYSPWGCEELNMTERLSIFTFHFHALEKEMATHSSVLAWRIPGMGEPGGPLSMGSHKVRHG